MQGQTNFIAGQVDVKVSTRATQTSVNTLQSTANIINGKADTINQAKESRQRNEGDCPEP